MKDYLNEKIRLMSENINAKGKETCFTLRDIRFLTWQLFYVAPVDLIDVKPQLHDIYVYLKDESSEDENHNLIYHLNGILSEIGIAKCEVASEEMGLYGF